MSLRIAMWSGPRNISTAMLRAWENRPDTAVVDEPFCRLLRFKRYSDDPATIEAMKNDPVVLVVAPLSGHHATLLRDTVRTLLQDHKVYVTDWRDARMVPLDDGDFGLDDYIATVRRFIAEIGAADLNVVAVCQPTVPVLAAVSLMASAGETTPRSLVLMGGPVDPRNNPTQVNSLATTKPLSWFRSQLIHIVPSNYPGHGRRVYPGFLQHMGFIAMNPSRHFQSHWDFYGHLVRGDLEDAEGHRRFYDEYNAVLDMPETYYLDTIEVVFQQHLLPRGEWEVDGERVRPQDIADTAILTIEGELDDISGLDVGVFAGVQHDRSVRFPAVYGDAHGRPQIVEASVRAVAPQEQELVGHMLQLAARLADLDLRLLDLGQDIELVLLALFADRALQGHHVLMGPQLVELRLRQVDLVAVEDALGRGDVGVRGQALVLQALHDA